MPKKHKPTTTCQQIFRCLLLLTDEAALKSKNNHNRVRQTTLRRTPRCDTLLLTFIEFISTSTLIMELRDDLMRELKRFTSDGARDDGRPVS